MSDYGVLKDNLKLIIELDKESPLTEREIIFVTMQFNYSGVYSMFEDFPEYATILRKLGVDYD